MTRTESQPDLQPLTLRIHDVCTLLDISTNTAYRRIDAGAEPFHNAYQEAGAWRVPVADLCQYLEARRVPVPRSLRQVAQESAA